MKCTIFEEEIAYTYELNVHKCCLKRPRGQKLRAKPAANILKSTLIRFAGLILCESRKLNFKLLGMLIVDLTHYSKMEKIPSLTAQVSVRAKSRLFQFEQEISRAIVFR